jgi:hypothetical protein
VREREERKRNWVNISDNNLYSVGTLSPPMPDRSRVMTQTKRDTLVLQVGGLAWG